MESPNPITMAVVTTAETSVEEKATKAHGADFPKLAGKVAVTKLWMHCRGRVGRDAGVRFWTNPGTG